MDNAASRTASETLAQRVVGIGTMDLPASTRHACGRACLDFVTCAMLGGDSPVLAATLRYFARTDMGRQATLLGRRERLSPASAAFVNATAAHGLDFDDGHTRAGGHPGASVFPAAFAVAEELGSTPDEIVRAVVAGYDAMVRVATMMHPRSAQRGWHNTAVAGTFGATAVAASLMKLDVERTVHAFGLAGSFTGGILEFLAEGPDVKRIHPGMAARDGITCAGLAAEGLTGPRRVFEGRHGIVAAMIGGEGDYRALHGDVFEIENAYFKLYPCCRHYHAAIDGVIDLRNEHGLALDDIRRIRLGLYGVAVRGHDHKTAETMLGAQMSAPIAAGLAVVDGAVSVQGFAPDSLARTEVRAAIDRVDVAVDPECERIYPGRRSGVVALDLADGRTLERRVLDPRGEGENPLADADLELKFRANVAPIIGAERAEEALGLIVDFTAREDAFTRLLGLLTPAD